MATPPMRVTRGGVPSLSVFITFTIVTTNLPVAVGLPRARAPAGVVVLDIISRIGITIAVRDADVAVGLHKHTAVPTLRGRTLPRVMWGRMM